MSLIMGHDPMAGLGGMGPGAQPPGGQPGGMGRGQRPPPGSI